MKPIAYVTSLVMIIAIFGLLRASESNIVSPAPYDGGKQIAKALKIAKREGKYVLIQSGARGCTWCVVMEKLLTTNPELVAKIKSDFVYAVVDTTDDQNRDFYKKYAHNTDHTLVLVALDAGGKQLSEKIGFDLVEDDPPHSEKNYHIDPKHILAMLNEWSAQNTASANK